MSKDELLDDADLDLLVSCEIGSEDEITEVIVRAFEAVQIDVFDKPTVLDDWVDTDVFVDLNWDRDYPIYLSTIIWDHRVIIASEQIRIYSDRETSTELN
jgi:hypothetical protein